MLKSVGEETVETVVPDEALTCTNARKKANTDTISVHQLSGFGQGEGRVCACGLCLVQPFSYNRSLY